MPSLKECESFIQQLNSSLKNFSFYPKGHPYVAQPIKRSYEMLSNFFKESDEVNISSIEGLIWVQNIPLPSENMWDYIMNVFKVKNKDNLKILKNITFKEWEDFVTKVALIKEEILSDEFSENIVFHSIESEDIKKTAEKVYTEAIDVVKNVISEVRMGRIPKADEVKSVVGKMVDMVLKDKQTMIGLSLIKSYDDYLFHHSVNVTILSLALGETLKIRPDLLREMGTAAMLHDIGKVSIDPKIVLKPDKLTDEEWEQMKKHPVTGYETLKKMEGVSEVVLRVALEHHMKYNLTGYPEVTKEYKLHPASMILSICDCYDAMTTHRVYQRCHEPREALEFMTRMAGVSFEPNYLKAFIKMLGIYPQGTLVKLNTGETAIVSSPNPSSPDEPVIKVIYDIFGTKLEKPKIYDLSQKPVDEETNQKVIIVGTVSATWQDIEVQEHLRD
ncbi:MAG: HD-GYP domain-containing protein [Proteobacteria bacterium]|nr:HD-GYP domain-containing protein [Pseudomonadota bacterium]